MVVVLVSCVILLAMVLGSLAFMSNSIKFSRHQQDTDLALAAAQSGLNDLLAQLRGDPAYLDGIAAPTDAYCQDQATGGPDQDYFAAQCGWTDTTKPSWESLSGGRQEFHYAIKEYSPVTEKIEVMSTGRSGDVTRTVKGYLSRETPDQWLYFSDYELADPKDYTTYSTWLDNPAESVYGPDQLTSEGCGGSYALGAGSAKLGELGYRWQMTTGSSVRRTYVNKGLAFACAEPDFAAGDVLEGPVHSNDTIRASGASFNGQFTTFDPKCKEAKAEDPGTWDNCVNGTAQFSAKPEWRDGPLELPSTDDPRAVASAGGKGCLYQGPTRIVLDGARMRVWSKRTTTDRAGCGTPAELKSAGGAEVDLPKDGLVYVDVADKSVAHVKIPSGGIGDGLPLGTYDASAPGPGVSYTYERAMQVPTKYDGVGNLFVEGEIDGSLTLAAHGSVVVTGDLVADDPTTDLLGVISGGSIEVYNPIIVRFTSITSGSGYIWSTAGDPHLDKSWAEAHDYDGDVKTFRIDAALYASTAGFGLQNWKEGGQLGTLHVYGSIAQRFRGIVGYHDDQTGDLFSGYKKKYVYNESLSKSSPLLFSPIKNGAWVISWLEKGTVPPTLRS
jgi:hypothetical protein